MEAMIRVEASVRAYPNLRQMAEILHVPKSTLSQRKLMYEPVGNEKRYRPRTVLEQALRYRRRDLDEVGQELVDHAQRVAGAALARAVQAEVDTALSALAEEPGEQQLEKLRREFDLMLHQMQEPDHRRRMRELFGRGLTPEAKGRAAVAPARAARSGGYG
jgi:hypothetical protein